MAIKNEQRQSLPILPDPRSKDQAVVNKIFSDTIKQIWGRFTEFWSNLLEEESARIEKDTDLQNQIKRIESVLKANGLM